MHSKSGLVRLVRVPVPEICIPASTNNTEKAKPKYSTESVTTLNVIKVLAVMDAPSR